MTSKAEAQPEEADAMLATVPPWLVQWPMIAFTGWWDAVLDAWQPNRCPPPAEGHDLAVPDPIESDGERALFA